MATLAAVQCLMYSVLVGVNRLRLFVRCNDLPQRHAHAWRCPDRWRSLGSSPGTLGSQAQRRCSRPEPRGRERYVALLSRRPRFILPRASSRPAQFHFCSEAGAAAHPYTPARSQYARADPTPTRPPFPAPTCDTCDDVQSARGFVAGRRDVGKPRLPRLGIVRSTTDTGPGEHRDTVSLARPMGRRLEGRAYSPVLVYNTLTGKGLIR